MGIALLRGLLIFQWLTAALAVFYGGMYLDWQTAPDEVIKGSPDAYHSINVLLSNWWMLKGACVGVTINMILLAIWQRREIAAASWQVKLHWIAFVLPIIVVFWFGEHIY